jgi:hypothetical protein
VAGRQAERLDQLAAARALHRDDRQRAVQVLDLDAVRCVGLQAPDDLAGVGGVRDEEDLVLAAHVGDEVVDDAARASSQQSVYCAWPTPTLRRSLVSRSLTKSTAAPVRARRPCRGG